MYNLKNQPETTDGIALNERIKKSSLADATYCLGWTYLGNEKLAEQADYDILTENTQSPKRAETAQILCRFIESNN